MAGELDIPSIKMAPSLDDALPSSLDVIGASAPRAEAEESLFSRVLSESSLTKNGLVAATVIGTVALAAHPVLRETVAEAIELGRGAISGSGAAARNIIDSEIANHSLLSDTIGSGITRIDRSANLSGLHLIADSGQVESLEPTLSRGLSSIGFAPERTALSHGADSMPLPPAADRLGATIPPENQTRFGSRPFEGTFEAPFAKHPWVTGKFNKDGVWVPIREYSELPAETRMHFDNLYASNPSLLNPAQIDSFVGMVAPVAQKFEPIASSAAPNSASETLAFFTGRSRLAEADAKLAKVADARVQAMIEPINQFYSGNKHVGIIAPPLKGRVFDPSESSATKSATMFFSHHDGVVGARVPDMLRLDPSDKDRIMRQLEHLPERVTAAEITGRFKHEARHGLQIYDVARIVAERLNLDKSGILEQNHWAQLQEAIGETLQPGARTQPSTEYLGRLIKTWLKDDRPITAQDRERVDGLISGYSTGKNVGQDYRDSYNKIKYANGFLNRIENGMETDALVKALSYHERGLIFGKEANVPEAIREIVQPGASLAGTRDIIGDTMVRHIAEQNGLRQTIWDRYYSSPEELEAYLEQMRVQEAANKLTREIGSATIH